MTPGTPAWVKRSLRDWALESRQGMALVTYRSPEARDSVIQDLEMGFAGLGLTTATLDCFACEQDDFLRAITEGTTDVLFVLDPQLLLFGARGDSSPFWFNFHREALIARRGVQIWWMSPEAAIRFGQQLPDLSRFFLFREDLKAEAEALPSASVETIAEPSRQIANPERARDLARRALAAASTANPDRRRVWTELGIPAAEALIEAGQWAETRSFIRQLEDLIDLPEAALVPLEASRSAAEALRVLSSVYGRLGRWSEALAAAERSVGAWRRINEERPDTHLPELAASLNVLAIAQSGMGQRFEALRSIAEAVAIYRKRAEANPDAFLPDLAKSLNNQATMQSAVGERAEALRSVSEAVTLYEKLAKANPDAFLPALAGSLNNQAKSQGEMGQRGEALRSVGNAVAIYRYLASANPDAFLPNLAGSLNNQARSQGEMGQLAEALRSIEEAVAMYRKLASANPDAFLPNLAGSLNNQARSQGAMALPAEALRSVAEAVAIYRKLAEANPNAFLPDLAGSLNNQATILGRMKRLSEALGSIAEAVAICRRLAERNPQAFLPYLARSLGAWGRILEETDAQAAAEKFAEAITTIAPFVNQLPQAHLPLALALSRSYMQGCESAKIEPSPDIVGHITEFNMLQARLSGK